MTPIRKETEGAIIDADILIDYVKIELTVLQRFSLHILPLYVSLPVIMEEVDQLDTDTAVQHNIQILEPLSSQVYEAVKISRGSPLSRNDALCYILARDNHYACLTNDKDLRRLCRNHAIPVIWGFELMRYLVEAKIITAKYSYSVAKRITAVNPRITEKVLAEFKRSLGI